MSQLPRIVLEKHNGSVRGGGYFRTRKSVLLGRGMASKVFKGEEVVLSEEHTEKYLNDPKFRADIYAAQRYAGAAVVARFEMNGAAVPAPVAPGDGVPLVPEFKKKPDGTVEVTEMPEIMKITGVLMTDLVEQHNDLILAKAEIKRLRADLETAKRNQRKKPGPAAGFKKPAVVTTPPATTPQ